VRSCKYLKKNSGYAYFKDLRKAGIHPDIIKKMLGEKTIEKVRPGLYKLADMNVAAYQG